MNLFSKLKMLLIAVTAFVGMAPLAHAIDLNVLYLSTCKREIGIILDVDTQKLKLLSLDGQVLEIPRHDVSFFAYYPITTIPIEEVTHSDHLQTMTVQTLHDFEYEQLVEGWPFNFTQENVSFLTTEGKEIVIDRSTIWKVDRLPAPPIIRLDNEITANYRFVHPFPFQHCSDQVVQNVESDEVQTIYPQQSLSDPVWIKRELDRLQEGHQGMIDYDESQAFYSVAHLNGNKISLGYWFNLGSRYGSGNSRSNNTTPVLINEFSEGPFGLQQKLVTGSAPLPYGIHEEAQTQVYYRVKGEYLRMEAMWDPSQLIYTDQKYRWRKEELDSLDNRQHERFILEGGLDYGAFTGIFGFDAIFYGVRVKDTFMQGPIQTQRIRLNYRSPKLQIHYLAGSGEASNSEKRHIGLVSDKKVKHSANLSFMRLNVEWFAMDRWIPFYSAIIRNFEAKQEMLKYQSMSLTNAFNLKYQYTDRLSFAGYFSWESMDTESKVDNKKDSKSKSHLKSGMNVTMAF